MADCEFTLRYQGNLASRENAIQLYDLAQALVGFERTISLTTHLLIKGEVLTQSPAVKGFQLYTIPFEEGSLSTKVLLVVGGIGTFFTAAGTAAPDTALGWLAKSALEYVIEETLGFEPDFDESLGDQIERYRSQENRTPISDDLSVGRFDSLIEKVEPGIKAIHRPIVKSATANNAEVDFRVAGSEGTLSGDFTQSTFDYIDRTITSEDFSNYRGSISSYNTNTFKGRIYVAEERRTIPFELSDSVRNLRTVNAITGSLRSNGRRRAAGDIRSEPDVLFEGLRNESVNGRLKSILVTDVDG